MKKNKLKNQTIEKIELQLNQCSSINTKTLFKKDIWCPEQDLGMQYPKHRGKKKFNFSNIKQPWLKFRVKQYVVYRKTQGISFNVLYNSLGVLNKLSSFLEKQAINSFQEIDEKAIELFIDRVCIYSSSHKAKTIQLLKNFFHTGNINHWFKIPIFGLNILQKSVKKDTIKIKYIPDEILTQLDSFLYLLPETLQRVIVLMRALGLRSCEISQLKFNCLKQIKNGKWEIHFVNSKFNYRLDKLPINEDIVALIKEQQQYIIFHLGEDFPYLFCGNKGGYSSSNKTTLYSFFPVNRILSYRSIFHALNVMSNHCQIKDKSGKVWNFTSHQFRRTVATKMTNEKVRQYIIQSYLRHKTPQMLQHYAELLPNTVKQEMEEFRQKKKIVDVTGREVKQIHSQLDNNIGLEWLRAKMQPKALAMGFGARPALLKPCPHANACMSCQHFRLDEDDLPALKQHLDRNQKLKNESQKLGYIRQIKAIEQDENQLINLINSLENSGE